MQKLRIGFVGAGGIMGVHAPILRRRVETEDDIELVGVADVHAPSAQSFAEKHGLAFESGDFRELVERVDAVLIAIPTHLHAMAAVEFLRAGKAVFCEKPLARTMEQADAILAASAESGAPLQIGFVRRFDEEWAAWGRAVEEARVGRPVMWRDVQSHEGPASTWYYQDEQGGGPFLDGCVHNYDWALKIFGPAEWAFCHARSLRGSSAFDSGSATIHFRSGDELLLAWSWGLPPSTSGASVFEILGPHGAILWKRDNNEPSFSIKRDDVVERVPFPRGALSAAFEKQMDEFIRVARGEAKPTAGGAEGRAALELALAVIESARTQQVVAL